ncbi:MAG: hypothetical protein RL367_620 [Pseudomonadota bacterium]
MALLGLCPSVTFAQTKQQDEAGEQISVMPLKTRTDLVVTATRSEQFPEFIGLAVTKISAEEIERRQTISVSDLLATTPGVTVSRNGGLGGFSAVRIRGAEGEQTLTLIDGVRVNDPSSPGGGFDFGNLLVGNIARIEVLRGPNSVPWGSQAIGGVVNLVSAAPNQAFEGAVRAEYGSHNKALLTGRAGSAGEHVTLSLGGAWLRDDGISSFAGGKEADGYRQYGGNAAISVKFSNALRAGVSGYYANSRTQIDGFPAPNYAFSDTAEFSTAREFYGSAFVGLNLLDDRLKQTVRYTLTDINRDNFDPASGPAPQFLSRGRSERFEYQGDATIIYAHLRTIFGVEHEKSRFTDGFSPASTSMTGGYLELIGDPVESLTITGGVRVDDHKSYGSKTILSGNLAFRPAHGTILRMAYGEGFKAPTLYQLYSFFGDVRLRPETARSFDLGIEQSLARDRLKVGVTLFKRQTSNQIDFDLNAFRYNNIAQSRARGVEFFANYQPTNHLNMSANYTYTDSEGRNSLAAPYARLLRRPEHSFSASADWQPVEMVSVGATLLTVSHSLDGFGGTIRLDGYTTLALRASVNLGHQIELYGRVENLFDTKYQTVADYGTYGRTAHVGVRAKF